MDMGLFCTNQTKIINTKDKNINSCTFTHSAKDNFHTYGNRLTPGIPAKHKSFHWISIVDKNDEIQHGGRVGISFNLGFMLGLVPRPHEALAISERID